MKIRELLAVESIDLNAKAANKKEALDHAVDLMARSGKIGDVENINLSKDIIKEVKDIEEFMKK